MEHAKELAQVVHQARDLLAEVEQGLMALSGIEQKLLEEQRLRQVVAGHLADERASHRRTQRILARMFGVEPNTEAYDDAFDRAVVAEQREGRAP